MARLKSCPDCGADVSKKAYACPKCGRVLRKKVGCLGKVFRLVLLLFVVIFIVALFAPKRPVGDQPAMIRRGPVPPEGPFERVAGDGLPAYRVVKVLTNGVVGRASDVIIPSLSPRSRRSEREEVARSIADKERLDEAWFYSTEDAQRANKSVSFASDHPEAMKKGYLGHLDHGQFRGAED